MTLREIQAMVLEADPGAKHYYSKSQQADFTTWQEYERSGLAYDDIASRSWKVQIDRYTRTEFDQTADDIEEVLNAHGIGFTHQVEYNPADGYIRHLFDCDCP